MKKIIVLFLILIPLLSYGQNNEIEFELRSGLYDKIVASIKLKVSNDGLIEQIRLTPMENYNPLSQEFNSELISDTLTFNVDYTDNQIKIIQEYSDVIVFECKGSQTFEQYGNNLVKYKIENLSYTEKEDDKTISIISGIDSILKTTEDWSLSYHFDNKGLITYVQTNKQSIAYSIKYNSIDGFFYLRKGTVWQNALRFEPSLGIVLKEKSVDRGVHLRLENLIVLSGISFSNSQRQIKLKNWEDLYLPIMIKNYSLDYENNYFSNSGIANNGIERRTQESSSYLQEDSVEYSASKVVTEENYLPWVEGVPVYGINETLSLSWDENISGLLIFNGFYDPNRTYLYKKNSRVKKLLITNKRGNLRQTVFLSDHPFPQFILLDRYTSDVTLSILDAFEGDAWSDTCINSVKGLSQKDSDLLERLLK